MSPSLRCRDGFLELRDYFRTGRVSSGCQPLVGPASLAAEQDVSERVETTRAGVGEPSVPLVGLPSPYCGSLRLPNLLLFWTFGRESGIVTSLRWRQQKRLSYRKVSSCCVPVIFLSTAASLSGTAGSRGSWKGPFPQLSRQLLKVRGGVSSRPQIINCVCGPGLNPLPRDLGKHSLKVQANHVRRAF